MTEIKKLVRVQIEFDAQELEDGRIEFELEGEKWVTWPAGSAPGHLVEMGALYTIVDGEPRKLG